MAALVTVVASRSADRQPVPKPSPVDGAAAVLAAGDALEIALYQAMDADSVEASEPARRLGCETKRIAHLIDVLRTSPIDELERALRALGRDLSIVVEKAA